MTSFLSCRDTRGSSHLSPGPWPCQEQRKERKSENSLGTFGLGIKSLCLGLEQYSGKGPGLTVLDSVMYIGWVKFMEKSLSTDKTRINAFCIQLLNLSPSILLNEDLSYWINIIDKKNAWRLVFKQNWSIHKC